MVWNQGSKFRMGNQWFPFKLRAAINWVMVVLRPGFFSGALGVKLDMDEVIEIDASDASKFSKHVVVKGMKAPAEVRGAALANNKHARIVISEFLAFLRARADAGAPQARNLFALDPAEVETSIIDTSVYSRNRCVRLLFSTKRGQRRPFTLTRGPGSQSPAMQLLLSMATFVPEGTPIFDHEILSREPRAPPGRSVQRIVGEPRVCLLEPDRFAAPLCPRGRHNGNDHSSRTFKLRHPPGARLKLSAKSIISLKGYLISTRCSRKTVQGHLCPAYVDFCAIDTD